jgi:hypothetical protein
MAKMNLSDREKALILKQREEDKIWNAALEAARQAAVDISFMLGYTAEDKTKITLAILELSR